MSHGYVAVQWTPYKKRYDLVLVAAVLVYLAAFFVVGKLTWRGEHAVSDEILLMRATSTCAFILLNFILCLGPLTRLNPRFLPLLYNRRHLGVTMFLVGLLHGLIAVGFYHGFGVISPFRSVLTSNLQYRSLSAFPFEILGLIALVILFVMAATSHDFWLKNLSARVWKSIHMMVYVAWMLLVLHVAFGALQAERNLLYTGLLGVCVFAVPLLHLIAAGRERNRDECDEPSSEEWVDVCGVDDIVESRGRSVCLPGRERVAVFRYDGKISAISNVCVHQGGPLGEGKILDGCITCPWHGFTYRPGDGCAPPPFTEKVPTYRVRVDGKRVMLNVLPLPPGTPVEPARIEQEPVHA